jgi:hypothetical protein
VIDANTNQRKYPAYNCN